MSWCDEKKKAKEGVESINFLNSILLFYLNQFNDRSHSEQLEGWVVNRSCLD